MRNLRQRVLLIHKLAQCVRAKIGIDNRRNSLVVNQVGRREHLVITDVHTLTDGTSHTSQTYTELIVELFTDGADTTVRQVVYIVHIGVRVNQLNKVLDNLYYIIVGKRALTHWRFHIKFAIDTITSYLSEVISFFGEEEVLYHFARCRFVSRFCITQLTIDVQHSLFFRVRRVFLQGIEDNRILGFTRFLFVQQNGLRVGFQNTLHQFGCQFFFALDDNLVTLNGNNLTSILIHEVFRPRVKYITGKRPADSSFKVLTSALNLFCQTETIQNILIRLVTNGTQQRRYGQFLLTVDISIHHIVDVGGKLYPRTAERYDTGRIKLGAVRVHRSAEEYTRRTVQLAHNHTFSTIDNERTLRGHIRDCPQEHVLNDGIKVLMVRVGAVQLELSLQGHCIGQTTLDTLVYAVVGMVNVIVKKLEDKIVARVSYRKILAEHLEQTFFASLFRGRVNLEKLTERFNLNIQKVRIRELLLHRREIDSLCGVIGCHLILYYLNLNGVF